MTKTISVIVSSCNAAPFVGALAVAAFGREGVSRTARGPHGRRACGRPACMLLSRASDLRITQVVDGENGVHRMMRKDWLTEG